MPGYGDFAIAGNSPAGSASAVIGNPASPLTDFESITLAAVLTGVAGGTLDVYVQMTPDEGTTWWDVVHFPQLAAGAGTFKYIANVARFGAGAAPVVTGDAVLAPNTIIQGEFGNQLRVKVVAGAGAAAGAANNISVKIQGNRISYRT